MSDRDTLDAALLAAHAAGDRTRLVDLYVEASQSTRGAASAFYLTHAYVFALEAGDPRATELRAGLVGLGAER